MVARGRSKETECETMMLSYWAAKVLCCRRSQERTTELRLRELEQEVIDLSGKLTRYENTDLETEVKARERLEESLAETRRELADHKEREKLHSARDRSLVESRLERDLRHLRRTCASQAQKLDTAHKECHRLRYNLKRSEEAVSGIMWVLLLESDFPSLQRHHLMRELDSARQRVVQGGGRERDTEWVRVRKDEIVPIHFSSHVASFPSQPSVDLRLEDEVREKSEEVGVLRDQLVSAKRRIKELRQQVLDVEAEMKLLRTRQKEREAERNMEREQRREEEEEKQNSVFEVSTSWGVAPRREERIQHLPSTSLTALRDPLGDISEAIANARRAGRERVQTGQLKRENKSFFDAELDAMLTRRKEMFSRLQVREGSKI